MPLPECTVWSSDFYDILRPLVPITSVLGGGRISGINQVIGFSPNPPLLPLPQTPVQIEFPLLRVPVALDGPGLIPPPQGSHCSVTLGLRRFVQPLPPPSSPRRNRIFWNLDSREICSPPSVFSISSNFFFFSFFSSFFSFLVFPYLFYFIFFSSLFLFLFIFSYFLHLFLAGRSIQ